MSLLTYVESRISIELDNGQTRLVSGQEKSYPFGECPEFLLVEAKENLKKHFALAGLVERFDEFLVIASLIFGWRKLYYASHNVTKKRPKKDQIDRATQKAIEKVDRLDRDLYAYAETQFAVMLERYQPQLPRQFQILAWQNRFYHNYRMLRSYLPFLTPKRARKP